ncbi:MAG: DUF5597 domain-containing protein [Oscillospiraceae bacterium]|nr:DUF5597 domain-containing protein [Oscillospiraceae bacterium]
MLAKSIFTCNGKPFYPIGAQAHNSSGYSMAELEDHWKACELMEVNSCAIAVSWERFEYTEGRFDVQLVKDIIEACRVRDLKLILLWFGTWKNGHMKYVPQWVKADRKRFPRVVTHDGYEIGNLSSFSGNTLEADKRAFCKLMETIKEADPHCETVIAVQIENELGIVGKAVRDFGPEAEKLFRADVPAEVMEVLRTGDDREYAVQAWKSCGGKTGSWTDVFGRYGDEALQAYSMTRFVEELAAAGKEILPMPFYVNVWLDQQGMDIAGMNYPAGGPVSKNLFFWRNFAPHLDMICPDMYQPVKSVYEKTIGIYEDENNPLYIPETGTNMPLALHVFGAIAEHGLTGVHFFGSESALDANGSLKESALPMKGNFQVLNAVWPLLIRERDTGHIHAVMQEEFQDEQRMFFDGVRGLARFGSFPRGGDYRHAAVKSPAERGRGLVIQTGEKEFIVCGAGFSMAFRDNPPLTVSRVDQMDDQREYFMNYLTVEEGYFDADCVWHPTRIRNGDETDFGVFVFPDHGAVRVVLDGASL